MAERIVNKAASFVEQRSSRHGFLMQLTLAASALTAHPVQYLLRPQSAAATILCPGECTNCCEYCPNTSSCCTENSSTFCCTLTGSNSCPSGTVKSGWWWCAVSTSVCPDGKRYYIDCNNCPYPLCCECAIGNCGNRKTCCYPREYGNCNSGQSLGNVRCRIVRCSNPGSLWPSECSSSGPSGDCPGPPC